MHLLGNFREENTNTTKEISWVVFLLTRNLRKAPSGRELSAKLTEGERVIIKLLKT